MKHARTAETTTSATAGLQTDAPVRLRSPEADGSTIVDVLADLEGLHALLPATGSREAPADDGEVRFRIRLASNEGQRSTASYLIRKMYGWRGYAPSSPDATKPAPTGITLVASDAERALATISIGFDSARGLVVEQLYPDEIRALRAQSARLCEFTRLAVDGADRSREVLAMLFHVAYMYARRLHHCTDIVIEVNPRHARFYERMLGFTPLGPERLCPRVGAPAVLLRLQLQHAEEQIARFGGHRKSDAVTRSLYPCFFSPEEENGIVGRLLTIG